MNILVIIQDDDVDELQWIYHRFSSICTAIALVRDSLSSLEHRFGSNIIRFENCDEINQNKFDAAIIQGISCYNAYKDKINSIPIYYIACRETDVLNLVLDSNLSKVLLLKTAHNLQDYGIPQEMLLNFYGEPNWLEIIKEDIDFYRFFDIIEMGYMVFHLSKDLRITRIKENRIEIVNMYTKKSLLEISNHQSDLINHCIVPSLKHHQIDDVKFLLQLLKKKIIFPDHNIIKQRVQPIV